MMFKVCFAVLALTVGCWATDDAELQKLVADNIINRIENGEDVKLSYDDVKDMTDEEITSIYADVMEGEGMKVEDILNFASGEMEQFILGRFGPQGDKGDDGDVGPMGLQGLPGFDGPPGSKGVQGVQGLPGQRGLPGFKGPRGFKGPQGLAGANIKMPKSVVNRILTAEYMMHMYQPYMSYGR